MQHESTKKLEGPLNPLVNILVEGRHTKWRGSESLPIPWKKNIHTLTYICIHDTYMYSPIAYKMTTLIIPISMCGIDFQNMHLLCQVSKLMRAEFLIDEWQICGFPRVAKY